MALPNYYGLELSHSKADPPATGMSDTARTLAMIDACVRHQPDGRMLCFGHKVADVALWIWIDSDRINRQPWMSLKEDRVAELKLS